MEFSEANVPVKNGTRYEARRDAVLASVVSVAKAFRAY